jgi:phage protein D
VRVFFWKKFMTPIFRIVADGADITSLINDRLLQLSTTDKPGMESDEFELRIDDRDGLVTLPRKGIGIEIYLGYVETTLTRLGRYVVDEVTVSGPPDVIVIKGKASDMRGSGKTIRSGSWENVPLSKIVSDVATRNGWQPVCPVTTKLARADQLSESDFNFITRLAKQYDCTAKVGDGKLLVMPRQGGQTASGKAFGAVMLTRSDVSRWQFRFGDRSAHKAVATKHQDKKTGKLAVVSLDNDDVPDGLPAVHTDRHIHPNKTAAESAAKARLAAFNRSSADVRFEMPGRTDLFAERTINAQGFKVGLDGEYLADSVEQVYTQAGWSTTVECNGGKNGKAKAKGRKKKVVKPVKVVSLK